MAPHRLRDRRGGEALCRGRRLRAPSEPPHPRGSCLANRHVRCHPWKAIWPTAVGESTNNEADEGQLDTRLIEAAQDYLACKGIPVALVQLPGSRPSTFVV